MSLLLQSNAGMDTPKGDIKVLVEILIRTTSLFVNLLKKWRNGENM